MSTTRDPVKMRALVVDDSAYNRQTIATMLESLPGVEVVGRAMNGRQALKLAFDLAPDLITLDLDMPEMDGFAFLRLLMTNRPTPVLVVSGYAQREHVFRALELGALDFLAKPTRDVSPDLKAIERELQEKVEIVRRLQAVRLRDRAMALAVSAKSREDDLSNVRPIRPYVPSGPPPACVVAIAASTGGPPALQQIVCAIDPAWPVALLIAQHMPARFTGAFAQRLDRLANIHVVEAQDGQRLCAGVAYVAPGAANLEVEAGAGPMDLPRVRIVPPQRTGGSPVITPSGDHLFASAAAQYGPRLCCIVLTGMGSDGREGVAVAHRAGATIVAEDPWTAVMPGMPYSVVETGLVHEVLRVEAIAEGIRRFFSKCLP